MRNADCGINEMYISQVDLKKRTKSFALCIIKVVSALPSNRVSDIIGKQILRSGTSVAANYRAACRARSLAEFISKMGIVEEEADETLFWMELMIESGVAADHSLDELIVEANEILAITVASIKTARKNVKK